MGLCVDIDISLAYAFSMSTTAELKPSGRFSDRGMLMLRKLQRDEPQGGARK